MTTTKAQAIRRWGGEEVVTFKLHAQGLPIIEVMTLLFGTHYALAHQARQINPHWYLEGEQ